MKRPVSRSGARLGWLDYMLTLVGSVLAVYSAGMSIDTPEIGYFCAALIVLGTICSYTVKVFAGSSKLIRLDGPMYAIAAIGAILGASSLMELLPMGGFPQSMVAAGGLCWMLVFGSFLSWGDSTLLFQAVPGIALFGLVGCYDTYRSVVFAFFGFLICLCTGFARAHGREMLRQAADSGYFDRAGIRFDPNAPEQSSELFEAIRNGPWRWVAGPEWALLSALAIVAISLLGAPVIQSSVQGVAGFVSIKLPATKKSLTSSPIALQDTNGSTLVGQGPITGMTGQAIYEAKLDHARYLRSRYLVDYSGKGWLSRSGLTGDSPSSLAEFTLQQLTNASVIHFEISPRIVTRAFALPGEFDPSNITDAHLSMTQEGTYVSSDPTEIGHFIVGTSMEAKDPMASSSTIRPAPPILLPFLDTQGTPSSVTQLAQDAVKNSKNDREKAEAIMDTIVKHAQYNANCAATPPGADPVEYFLFQSHQGYCDLFASSMTLMARSVGIPARYVMGYLPDEITEAGGTYVIRDKDYHAWAELFFKDVGWVVYDPTSRATLAEGGELKVRNPNGQDFSFVSALTDLGIGGLAGAGAWLLWRSRKRLNRTGDARRSEVEEAYVSYARTMRSFTGRRRLLSETPSEYLNQTRFALNGAFEKAELLTRKFERALYSPEDSSDQSVAELQADLRELKQMLKAESRQRKAREGASALPSQSRDENGS